MDAAELVETHRALRACEDVDDLFAAAADRAPTCCGFARALVVRASEAGLTAGARAQSARAGDALRRRLRASPVPMQPGTQESGLLRRGRRSPSAHPSALAETLGLGHFVLAAIAPETTTLAVLVVDREGPAVAPDELRTVDAYAAVVGIGLERVVLRRRVSDLADEVRQFAGMADVLAREAVTGAIELPGEYRAGLPRFGALAAGRERLASLSDREQAIAELLVRGRTNREIAEVLVLSPETVKSHVARILRKLGVANRVEAAAVLLQPGG